ncbi:MAG: hypothetical protein ABIP34_06110 [Rhodoferax sp.]|uniref:hypothetical protein n=1 Tax=Rhodoferax sp. TaxID=50421 RepID=UPI003266EDB8
MRPPPPPHYAPDLLTAYFWSGDTLRSRNVSGTVLHGLVDVPAPPARLVADWARDATLRLGLEPGNVEALSLPRARMRWPDYRHCVQAAVDWTQAHGLQNVLAASDVALMACRGARYHHDGAQYGGAAFCNLFLSEDQGLDVHFPVIDLRIPLAKGTVLVFDTGQPHAVVPRDSTAFNVADFPPERDCTLVFLTWELPVEQADVGHALQINFDTDPATAFRLDAEQVWRNGAPAALCPESGRWCSAG